MLPPIAMQSIQYVYVLKYQGRIKIRRIIPALEEMTSFFELNILVQPEGRGVVWYRKVIFIFQLVIPILLLDDRNDGISMKFVILSMDSTSCIHYICLIFDSL